MEVIPDFFHWLYDEFGINLPIFYDAWQAQRYLDGILTTLALSVITIAASLVIGMIGAWIQMAGIAPLRWIVYAYIQFFRNTPPLAQLYFFYFGLGSLTPRAVNDMGIAQPIIGNFEWALIALSLFAGAFNIEIFRSGIEAVPSTTVEAARALGYNRWKTYRYVILPLAVRISMPSLVNNLVNLLKTTAIAYAIGVAEVLYVANQIWAIQLNVPEMMNVVLVTYLAIVGGFVSIMSYVSRRLRMPGYSI